MNDIINEYEIRVWALRRSGHHAIINWIASMFNEPVWYFNFVKGHNNPYRKRKKYHGTMKQQPELSCYFSQEPWKYNYIERERIGPTIYKSCLIYNHEDQDLKICQEPIQGLGKSSKQFSILIMRSFKNMLASRLHKNPQWNLSKIQKYTYIIPKLYPMYANEFLGITSYLTFTPIKIWFDLWFISEQYRILKAKELGLQNSNQTLKYMATYGKKGSTFNPFNSFKDNARKMDVLHRYKYINENETYHQIIQENESFIKLSDKIHEEEFKRIH